MKPLVRTIAAASAALGCVAAAGCGSAAPSAGGSSGASETNSAVSGTITVFAAASLTGAFHQLAAEFEKAHPGTHVRLSFGGSSSLALQINHGAPADVFASAAPVNMKQVLQAGNAAPPSDFAKNIMEIAVPPGNPAHVKAVGDLARPGVKVAVCQPQVPCGTVAHEVFTHVGITVTPATQEPNVKATLTKVETNEVDAGMVYVTDVRAAGSKVVGVPIPPNLNASTEYPIATLKHAPNPAGARAFTAFVLSDHGRQALTAAGFEKP